MKKFSLILLLGLTVPAVQSNDDFGAFLTDLNEIATKTKQNIDYMPSTVSVLKADELRDLGANTIYDALSFVPGIETSMIHSGWKRIITRGLHNPDSFVFDKMKLFIDGVSVSSRLFGTIYYYMDFPLDLVERIEVLRGAASALYGDGAFNGAINVITKLSNKETKNEAHVSYGSDDYRYLSAVTNFSYENFHVGIDVYGQKNNRHVDVSRSFILNPTSTFDAQTNEELKNWGVGFNVSTDRLSFFLRHNAYESGNYFGLSQYLEPKPDNETNRVETTILGLQHTSNIATDTTFTNSLELQTMNYKINSTTLQAFPMAGLPYDVGLGSNYKEISYAYNGEISIHSFKNHTILVGIEADKTDVERNRFWTNVVAANNPVWPFDYIDNGNYTYYNVDGYVSGEAGREHFGLYLQDIYDYSEKLAFSMNVRYDNYEKFDSDINFRLGAVFEANDALTIKAQYAESFRVPSFSEAFQVGHFGLRYGKKDLENEKQKSYELSFVYKPSPSDILRVNGYYAKYFDNIDIFDKAIGDITYTNSSDREAHGVELEYKREFSDRNKLALLYSYQISKYTTPNQWKIKMDTPSMANHLAKLYYLYSYDEKLKINPSLSYVGERDSQLFPGAPVYDLDDYFIASLSSTYAFSDDLRLQLSINDLFNDQAILPSSRSQHPYLPREGRTYLASLHYEF